MMVELKNLVAVDSHVKGIDKYGEFLLYCTNKWVSDESLETSYVDLVYSHCSLYAKEKEVIKIKEECTESEDRVNKIVRSYKDINGSICSSMEVTIEKNEDYDVKSSIHVEERCKCELCAHGYSMLCEKLLHSERIIFQCVICSQIFKTRMELNLHERTRTDENCFNCRYKCELCPRVFRTSSHLKYHVRTHTGEKPYSCKLCHNRFSQSSHLKAHHLIHTGEKPFSCEVCHKGFLQKSYLKLHNLTHTGEKSFKCEICHKDYAWKNSLRKHNLKHTRAQHDCGKR